MAAFRTTRWVTAVWRTALITLVYTFGLVIAGSLAGAERWPLPMRAANSLLLTVVSGVGIGITLTLIFGLASWSRWQRFAIGACAVFFTMLSTTIEGAFFAPKLVGSVPTLVFMDVVAGLAVGAAGMADAAEERGHIATTFSWSSRTWYSWAWRLCVSAASYVLFYWIYGALNYLLLTRPYYSAQQTTLQVPSAQAVLGAEAIRGPLLVLAVLPLVLTSSLTRRRLALSSSAVLFIIGGVVPLLRQAGVLPTFLLIASGWEIFLQNVSLALVITWLSGNTRSSEHSQNAKMGSRADQTASARAGK
jgi:hypothetical protein